MLRITLFTLAFHELMISIAILQIRGLIFPFYVFFKKYDPCFAKICLHYCRYLQTCRIPIVVDIRSTNTCY